MHFHNLSDPNNERYVHGRSDGTLSIGYIPIANLTGGDRGYSSTAYDQITILSDGKVGIGSDTPLFKLDVAGDARVQGTLNVMPAASGHTTFQLGSRDADPLPSGTGSYDFKPGMRVSSFEPADGAIDGDSTIPLVWTTTDVSTSSPGYLAASQTYATASWSETFTVNYVGGTRWFAKIKTNDAESGNDPRVAVNGGTEYKLEYADSAPSDGENDTDSWHVIDITDDVVTGSNTIKVWLAAGQKTYVLAVYVFPSTGIALPNEPYETTLYADNGIVVPDTGKVMIGSTSPIGDAILSITAQSAGQDYLRGTNATGNNNVSIGNLSDDTGYMTIADELGATTFLHRADSQRTDMMGAVGINTTSNAFGLLQVNQINNNDESGIGILDNTGARSMRLWVDSTDSYVSSGNGGGGVLQLNEGGGLVLISKGSTADYTANQAGVVKKTFQVHDTYDTAGTHWSAYANLDGNWLDGTSGADSQHGWIFGHSNQVRGGLIYDHRSTERMAMWSSYGKMDFLIANAADGDGVPIDSNIVEAMTIIPGGDVGIGITAPTHKLHVRDSVNEVATFETSLTSDMAIQLKNSQGSMYFGLDGSENFGIGTDWDLNGANGKFTVTSTGSVGINRVSPVSTLDIRDTGTYNILQMVGSAGNYTGIKLARGDGTWSSVSNNQFGLLVTDYGMEVTKLTALGDNTTGRLAAPYMQFETDTADNVGIGTTAFDAVVEDNGVATSKFIVNYTGLLGDKFGASSSSVVWGAMEPKPIRPSRIRSTAGTAGNCYTNSFGSTSSSVVGEADLSAIDADATFTFAAAWAALETHGARMPTLSEIMAGVGQGSGQGYDDDYLWTQTFAGPHHVWVVRGAYSSTTSANHAAKIVDITDPLEVYRTRGFFDASHKNMSVHYDNNESITTNELMARGDVTAYYSDERLKDFQGTIPDALAKVNRINGYLFTENELAKQLGYNNDRIQAGVSAQEVEAVLPEVVKEAPINEDKGTDYKTVQYDRLVPLLIEAVKELSAKVDLQQQEIDRLKGL